MSTVVDVVLAKELAAYRDRKPTKKERSAEKIDGSQIELRIISSLVRAGVDDAGIIEYFDHHQLPRYTEEGGSESWLRSLIKRARAEEASRGDHVVGGTVNPHTPRVEENQHTLGKKRSYADPQLPFFVLKQRLEREAGGEFMLLGQWYREIIEVSGRSAFTKPLGLSAARDLARRLRERGYVTTERLPANKQRVLLTEKGRASATPLAGGWSRFIPIRSARKAPEREDDGNVAPTATTASPKKTTRPRRRPPSEQRKREQRIALARKHEQINSYHRISLRGNKVRHLQLLSAPEEWIGATMWEGLNIGYDANGRERLAWIAYEEADDTIAPLLPESWEPHECVFALAAELVPRDDTYVVGEYIDENGELLPSIGIIEQSFGNFFGTIAGLADPTSVLKVTGVGSKKQRKFKIVSVADPISIETDITIDGFLQGLDISEHDQHVAQLPLGWYFMPPQRKKLVWRLLGH